VTAPTLDYPCLLFALGRESQFLRRAGGCRRLRGLPFPTWLYRRSGRAVLVLEGGIGPSLAEASLSWLLSQPLIQGVPYRPRFLIAAGFSGALRDGLAVGDVILASEIVDVAGHCWAATWPEEPQENSFTRRARMLCSSHLIGDPAEKRRLGEEHGAWAVDMETATSARICASHGIPFGCVRAISDDVDTSLSPRLVSLLSVGRASPLRIVAALASSPSLGAELWRLAKQTRQAGERLARALEALLAREQHNAPPATR
jgi:adenosylhomocysteine nucleosidase